MNVPLQTISQSSADSSNVLTTVRTAAGAYTIGSCQVSTTSTPWNYMFDLPPLPYQVGNAGNNAPRGFQLTDVTLAYSISSGGAGGASANASAMSLTAFVWPSSGFTDGATISTPSAYGGTFTYNWGSSTGLTSMASSGGTGTTNVVVCVPATGTNSVINTDNQRMTFELALIGTNAATSFTFRFYDVTIHGKWIMGG